MRGISDRHEDAQDGLVVSRENVRASDGCRQMKGLFPQYDQFDPAREAEAWRQGLFVFDTNVLLNLYRYRATTRDELIQVLGKLAGRIWIPHHVALEFQRNRLKVIAEQSKRFSEVRKAVEKARLTLTSELDKLQLRKRHSLIDPQPLTDGFDALANDFLGRLDQLQQTQQGLTAPDPLKQKIEALFDGRVGSAPESQEVVEGLYAEAALRFKAAIPPGYQDSDKDKGESDEHSHGGIRYKKKYGDFLVWRQITLHAKAIEAKRLIFVTDDGKEDWWLKIQADGPKTIGPRPELIEEAWVQGTVTTFLMYSPEGFLKYAGEFLKASVSEETLREVRDLSISKVAGSEGRRESLEFGKLAHRAVYEWLASAYETVEVNGKKFPDFLVVRDGKRYGYAVKAIGNNKALVNRILEAGAVALRGRNDLAQLTLVLVFPDPPSDQLVKNAHRLISDFFDRTRLDVTWLLGVALPDQGFVALHEYQQAPR